MGLLEQLVRGGLDAFESIFREYQNEVCGWIVPMVRDPAAAEDLTTETFRRIYLYTGSDRVVQNGTSGLMVAEKAVIQMSTSTESHPWLA